MPKIRKTIIKESNLSRSPPCPGMIFPESFIDAYRFSIETTVSPTKDKAIINSV